MGVAAVVLLAGLAVVPTTAFATTATTGPTGPTGPAVSGPAAAAVGDPGDVWDEVSERPRARLEGLRQRVAPRSYTAHRLDLDALSARLDRAPLERSGAAPLLIQVPAPDGELVEFAVVESPVMEPGLAAQHPEISTWSGTTTGRAPASIRLDVTPMGFHASVRGAGATWYVDPAYNGPDQGDDALYLSYAGSDLPARDQPLVEPDKSGLAESARRASARAAATPDVGEGGGAVAVQRTYRLALATDPSYAAYFETTSNAVVTAEKVTLVNRVNHVYGDDLSIRMLLVAGNDALNFNTAAQFSGGGGRCGNVACYVVPDDVGCGDVIDTNRFVLGQVIGADRYDIGHIMFGPDGDGGGVAYLGAVGTIRKAGGCTGLDPPTGDGFAIDYVAHEIGHQFSGNHTFNGTTASCSGTNRNRATSVEPGSGSTVMAYAGICGVDNLQRHSDPYFSQRSQQEIAAFTRSTPGNVREVQNVALRGFTTTGESFSISYGATPARVTVGSTYSPAGLKAALEAAEPSGATATVVGSKGTTFGSGANGFRVTWSGSADIATPTVTLVSGSFTSIVGTYDNGGPETNRGFANPVPTGNRNPTVTAPPARTIPRRTPFTLTGSATDADGDPLVHLWEQNNPGSTLGAPLNSNLRPSGPLFRVFGTYAAVSPAGTQQYESPGLNLAGTSPTRSFPDAAQVAAGATNAATGACPRVTGSASIPAGPVLDCYSELLPTTARTMSFRLTARDLGGPDGGPDGGTAYADTTLTVGSAGPFAVTSQATATPVTGGTTGTVAWSVAGTDTATYATDVSISFSTDGGLTFPTVLVASTANDGSQTVTWPDVATSRGRIRVEAVGNYFYDVNDGAISVTPGSGGPGDPDTTAPETTIAVGPAQSGTVLTRDVAFRFASEPGATYGCVLNGAEVPCPDGTLTRRLLSAGTYDLYVAATDAAGNTDPTPVRRRFYVPVDDARLRVVKGTWRRVAASGYFRSTFVAATRRTSTLSYPVVGATSLALVLSNARSFGSVDVFLGSTRLATVDARGTARTLRIASLGSYATPRSGTLRIVSRGDAQVRIDGLVVRTAAPATLSR